MIAVDFLHIEHKIHRDHEDAARARAPGGRLAAFPRLFHQIHAESHSMIME